LHIVERFDAAALKAFRNRYPTGDNYVVAEDVGRSHKRQYHGIRVKFVSLLEIKAGRGKLYINKKLLSF